MSALPFLREVNDFCTHMLNQDLALNISSHKLDHLPGGRQRVSWRPVTERDYDRGNDLSLKEYMNCLRCGDFSLLLSDGGIVQLSVTFEGADVVESRFYYIPCPISLNKDELLIDGEVFPLEDFIDSLTEEELRQRVCIRAPFRFELDPENAKGGHPLNHVHIGPSSSRIPVALPLCWNAFARFIFKNFYPNEFSTVLPFLKFPVSYRQRTITDLEANEVHIGFGVARPGA